MNRRKRIRTQAGADLSLRESARRMRQSQASIEQDFTQLERTWVTGPTLRKVLDVSAVTLWRWRRNPGMGFPTAKRINNRTFFAWHEVLEWLDKQPDAA